MILSFCIILAPLTDMFFLLSFYKSVVKINENLIQCTMHNAQCTIIVSAAKGFGGHLPTAKAGKAPEIGCETCFDSSLALSVKQV